MISSAKSVLRVLILTTAALGLVGCKTFVGQISSDENLLLDTKEGEIEVAAGVQQAELTFTSKQDVRLTVQDINGDERKVLFRVPKGTNLPQGSGVVRVPASENWQPYDIVGTLDTQRSSSDLQIGNESCSYQDTQRECKVVQKPGGGSHRVCRDNLVTRWGTKWVEFYYDEARETVTLELFVEGEDVKVATFRGSRNESQKIVTRAGPCN